MMKGLLDKPVDFIDDYKLRAYVDKRDANLEYERSGGKMPATVAVVTPQAKKKKPASMPTKSPLSSSPQRKQRSPKKQKVVHCFDDGE